MKFLFVFEASAQEEVTIDRPELRVRPGDEARVDCSAIGRVRVERVEWTRHGAELPPGEQNKYDFYYI